MGMNFKEWEKLRKENPEQYQKEYCKFITVCQEHP